jgi:hypothetical protein
MKKIAKLIAISLCLAAPTFAMQDLETQQDPRSFLSSTQQTLSSLVQSIDLEKFQDLVNHYSTNPKLVTAFENIYETLACIKEDVDNANAGLLIALETLDQITDSNDVDLLASSYSGIILQTSSTARQLDRVDSEVDSENEFGEFSSGHQQRDTNADVIEEINSDEEQDNG